MLEYITLEYAFDTFLNRLRLLLPPLLLLLLLLLLLVLLLLRHLCANEHAGGTKNASACHNFLDKFRFMLFRLLDLNAGWRGTFVPGVTVGTQTPRRTASRIRFLHMFEFFILRTIL